MSAIPKEVGVDKYICFLSNINRLLRPSLPYSKENSDKIKSTVVKQLESLEKLVKSSDLDFNQIRDVVKFLVFLLAFMYSLK